MLSVQLECRGCGWRTVCGEGEITRRLRKLGLFRRASDPPSDLVREVLASHASRLTCDACGATGLSARERSAADDDAGPWGVVATCEICRRPIPPERLQARAGAKRCVECQDAEERGLSPAEPEYCPKCGALLVLRASRGAGITRYKLYCTAQPPCRLQ